ncbi:hypothetical protein QR680_007334 [Steinernema hermaphroditum]|uniref:Uncharacterized protein n=1 Tax=Steinernema hermaphroditum TaxID=289476 RepID=A0AA39IFD4_9BILA|nr:hypothetical protein QR680_007334 [Steinernema hermaphroditum]
MEVAKQIFPKGKGKYMWPSSIPNLNQLDYDEPMMPITFEIQMSPSLESGIVGISATNIYQYLVEP